MDRKILHVAGVTFAVVFIAIFITMWQTSSKIVGKSVAEMNSLYSSQYAIDLSLFDGKIVTKETVNNLEEELDTLKHIYKDLDVVISGNGETYKAELIDNDNGMVGTIKFVAR